MPLVKGVGKSCGYCGNPDEGQLTEGDDQRYGFENDWLCKDEHSRACVRRRERRWPPRPDRVDPVLMKLAGQADEEQAARARQQYRPPAPEPAQEQQEPAQQQGWRTAEGWTVTAYGSYDVHGGWHPPLPQWHSRSHLISGGADMSHTIAGGNDPLRGRHPHGAVSGAQSASGLPGGTAPPAPQDGGQAAPGLVQGAEGGDVVIGQVPGGQWMAPLPEHGAKLKRPAPRRRGAKLAYSSGRKPARKHGIAGSDSFNSSLDTGGPGGGAPSSAEIT